MMQGLSAAKLLGAWEAIRPYLSQKSLHLEM
jgi:hypothetical protein